MGDGHEVVLAFGRAHQAGELDPGPEPRQQVWPCRHEEEWVTEHREAHTVARKDCKIGQVGTHALGDVAILDERAAAAVPSEYTVKQNGKLDGAWPCMENSELKLHARAGT